MGPILFLVMIYDMPNHLIKDSLTASSRIIGYADDTTVYIKAKTLQILSMEFERLASIMIDYCNENNLVINSQKTQILTSSKQQIKVKIGQNMVSSSETICLLGLEYDENFSTAPYLRRLSREASTREALIKRLSFGMPNCLLKPFANGLLMGKILAAAPATTPVRIKDEDRSLIGVTEDINKSIKAVARTITKTKLSDKIHSETVLSRAGLKCLNEAVASIMAVTVWKSKQAMHPLGRLLFQEHPRERCTRSATSNNICQPVPGYPTLPSNLMAKIWNSVPGLQSATTLGAAKTLSRKWAKSIPR